MKLYSLPPLPDLPYAYSGGIELYFTYDSSRNNVYFLYQVGCNSRRGFIIGKSVLSLF
jgi:hypothetical protein